MKQFSKSARLALCAAAAAAVVVGTAGAGHAAPAKDSSKASVSSKVITKKPADTGWRRSAG